MEIARFNVTNGLTQRKGWGGFCHGEGGGFDCRCSHDGFHEFGGHVNDLRLWCDASEGCKPNFRGFGVDRFPHRFQCCYSHSFSLLVF